MEPKKLIERLGEGIYRQYRPHPLRVAIDGVDAAGKTTLADELAEYLQQKDRDIIRASVDDFHHPSHIRKAQGDLSPEGYYQDSFNYEELIQYLLQPLGPGGSCLYRITAFDLEKDQPALSPQKQAPKNAIFIIDGIFLLRPELINHWDIRIFLNISFKNAVKRGSLRDAKFLGSLADSENRYRTRYVPGQKLYLSKVHPLDKADIVIDNNKLEDPDFIKLPPDF